MPVSNPASYDASIVLDRRRTDADLVPTKKKEEKVNDQQTYGMSRMILRLLKSRSVTLGQLDRELEAPSRMDTLSALRSLERRGYPVRKIHHVVDRDGSLRWTDKVWVTLP